MDMGKKDRELAMVSATSDQNINKDEAGSSGGSPLGSFADIRELVGQLPAASEDDRSEAAAQNSRIGLGGDLASLVEWMSAWQGRHPPQAEHARICVFAATHGTRTGVQATSALEDEIENVAGQVAAVVDGHAAVNAMARLTDADLKIFEMGLERSTKDIRAEAAMGEAETMAALAYGMTAVEPGIQLLVLDLIPSAGLAICATALAASLFGGVTSDWIEDEDIASAATAGMAANPSSPRDPLGALAQLGGQDIAAIIGATLAARAVQVPVLFDGFAAALAASVLEALKPGLADHCAIATLPATPSGTRLASTLGRTPLLRPGLVAPEQATFGGRVAVAVAGALAIEHVRAGIACHKGLL
jgi:nicotinate-nucleotide--dimethylbenzimidazole phosphoribosyltransferase